MRRRRCTGSAPLSGSSSTSTSGFFTRAAATLLRWRMPLLKPSMLRSAAACISHGVERPVDDPAVGDAVQVGDVGAELAGRQAARAPLRPRARAPGARYTDRSRRGERPSTTTLPWLTGMRPVMARIRVVLPAPFGPSRPGDARRRSEQLSSDSATFWPNHTDTSVATTVASATKAGSSAARRGRRRRRGRRVGHRSTSS